MKINKKLRIAQIGSIWETTPPKLYGGTERIVSSVTEELVRRGHDVTLYATGDSKTKAKLVSITKRALYRQGIPWENVTLPLVHIHQVFKEAKKFDIIHCHLNLASDYLSLALADLLKTPAIFTIHHRLPSLKERGWHKNFALKHFSSSNYISISNSQRKIRGLNYLATVYNGIETDKYKFSNIEDGYLAWIGRFTADKGPKESIQVGLKLKKPVKLAGKLDQQDKNVQQYYQKDIAHYLKEKKNLVSYIGEINDQQKNTFFGQSKVLLNPLNWEEPFGLVVVEANACGTPVIAFARGAMPELIKDGINGYVVKPGDLKEMVKIAKMIYTMPQKEYRLLREKSRTHVEQFFSVRRMVQDYENAYYKVLSQSIKG